MDGVDIGLFSDIEDLVDREVGRHGWQSCADQIGLVRFVAVLVVAILFAVDADCGDSQFSTGSEYADRDLTAVCA